MVAVKKIIEDGQAIRGDTTTTKTNIYFPTDASLLTDVVRVLTRSMNRLVRALNTQPALVMRFEADTETRLEEYRGLVEGRIEALRANLSRDSNA